MSSGALAATGVLFAAVLVFSDVSDPAHEAWRDPLSFFGSPEAPRPQLFNLVLAALGVAVVFWAAVRAGTGPRPALALVAAAGVAMMLLALWPIDCSPIDVFCEVVIRGRAVSDAHVAHSVVALVFFVLLGAITVASCWPLVRSGDRRRLAGAVLVVGSLACALVIVRPFSPGAGLTQLVALSCAVGGLALGLSTARTTGTPTGP